MAQVRRARQRSTPPDPLITEVLEHIEVTRGKPKHTARSRRAYRQLVLASLQATKRNLAKLNDARTQPASDEEVQKEFERLAKEAKILLPP